MKNSLALFIFVNISVLITFAGCGSEEVNSKAESTVVETNLKSRNKLSFAISPYEGKEVYKIDGLKLKYSSEKIWSNNSSASCLCCAYDEKMDAFYEQCVEGGHEIISGYEGCCSDNKVGIELDK